MAIRQLKPAQLRRICDPTQFDFGLSMLRVLEEGLHEVCRRSAKRGVGQSVWPLFHPGFGVIGASYGGSSGISPTEWWLLLLGIGGHASLFHWDGCSEHMPLMYELSIRRGWRWWGSLLRVL